MRRGGTNGEAGFSLIELIVSLALFALILALLPGAFRTGKRGWETAADIEQRTLADASVNYLRHRLAETMLVYDRDESGRSKIAFSGEQNQVSFVAPAQSGPFGGGLYRFGVSLRPGVRDGTSDLVVNMAAFKSRTGSTAPPAADHVLMSDVASFQLRYFGAPAPGQDAGWGDVWTRTDRLPSLIGLEAVSARNGGASIGPLLIELRLKALAPG